jgi:hypothetical protein
MNTATAPTDTEGSDPPHAATSSVHRQQTPLATTTTPDTRQADDGVAAVEPDGTRWTLSTTTNGVIDIPTAGSDDHSNHDLTVTDEFVVNRTPAPKLAWQAMKEAEEVLAAASELSTTVQEKLSAVESRTKELDKKKQEEEVVKCRITAAEDTDSTSAAKDTLREELKVRAFTSPPLSHLSPLSVCQLLCMH